ncbi:MAG: dihydrofolate reductase family protein, partial [Phycisphaerae bacterium]|nr:dihydrofolate reductase family protein [Phycisphaerae bacterium]NIP55832.1 dihydrofolate reductase family protein [Phycisphaerae bacterium]NIX32219.1 hypothetical protein [Phycisphaerae bacterium]
EARNGEIDIAELVAALGRASIKSILVEGGATTFRSFLVSGCVDWIQVHVAPIIFGSGNSLLELPAIDAVGDGIRLRNHFWFDFDGEVMVTGQP